jgi:hypothetical protein
MAGTADGERAICICHEPNSSFWNVDAVKAKFRSMGADPTLIDRIVPKPFKPKVPSAV